MALETVFPPILSETVFPLAGFEVSQGEPTFLGALAAATLGALVGALALYCLARLGGRATVAGYDRLLRVSDADLDRADRWFAKRGTALVFLGRMVPGARSLVSIPAGFAGMPVLRFALVTAAGSAVWNAALLAAGALLGQNYREVDRLPRPNRNRPSGASPRGRGRCRRAVVPRTLTSMRPHQNQPVTR